MSSSTGPNVKSISLGLIHALIQSPSQLHATDTEPVAEALPSTTVPAKGIGMENIVIDAGFITWEITANTSSVPQTGLHVVAMERALIRKPAHAKRVTTGIGASFATSQNARFTVAQSPSHQSLHGLSSGTKWF